MENNERALDVSAKNGEKMRSEFHFVVNYQSQATLSNGSQPQRWWGIVRTGTQNDKYFVLLFVYLAYKYAFAIFTVTRCDYFWPKMLNFFSRSLVVIFSIPRGSFTTRFRDKRPRALTRTRSLRLWNSSWSDLRSNVCHCHIHKRWKFNLSLVRASRLSSWLLWFRTA